MVISLQTARYRLCLAGHSGATIVSAEWCKPDGTWMAILAPLDEPDKGLSAGCFLMAPFANRIVGGRFRFGDREFVFPMNRPGSNMACHGIARDLPWSVLDVQECHATLECIQQQDTYPWQFHLQLRVCLQDDGIDVTLRLRNLGQVPLPFGLGLHPYFPKRPDTRITFCSGDPHVADAMGLPLPEREMHTGCGLATPLAAWSGIDTCFPDWAPQSALIDWPSEQARLVIKSEGAFRHLHLFVPHTRDVFCMEPVSHLPDAVNRPWLGPSEGMHILSPGEDLSGTLRLQMVAGIVSPETEPADR